MHHMPYLYRLWLQNRKRLKYMINKYNSLKNSQNLRSHLLYANAPELYNLNSAGMALKPDAFLLPELLPGEPATPEFNQPVLPATAY